ncbi:purple acid phosphatase 3-like [Andrographis paniculata]|uniref:purple acid phosphatase 3-like n=1 Tax=Andrographis paniculata TaxID=175694 RepID=UPI0021E98B8D|nr:purple acid phosphatase 3-like [Andrographis paniculata]
MGKIGEQLGIDLVISTGDNFYDEGLKSVKDPLYKQSFTDIYTAKSLQKPWYAVLGNHDYLGSTGAQLSKELRRADKRWHCERNFLVKVKGLVDFIFVDTTPFVDKYFKNPKKQKFDWSGVLPRDKYISAVKESLDSTLRKSKATWKIVIAHHTIRSIGHHGDTLEVVEQILPILEKNKVHMYINGHDHCLEHLSNADRKLQFLTSGGGSKAWKKDIHYGVHNDSLRFYYDGQGFLAVKLTRKSAKMEFYDVAGKVLHRMDLKP